ncbi:MAG: class II aldolase/adducin family protein [Anaerolineae bacterium]
MTDAILEQLVDMTRLLGQPHLNYVIIGEGNTSFRVDADTFWIKASGQGMSSISDAGFVQVRFAPILELLEQQISASALQAAMMAAKVDPKSPARPSGRGHVHAALLHGCDVRVIGHTHPLAVNAILCSDRAEQFATNRMFPDEVVLCGPRSVLVPYVDPGLPLSLAIRDRVRSYSRNSAKRRKYPASESRIDRARTDADGSRQYHGDVCQGRGIFSGACALGEPVFMTPADIMHIYRRPDEIYRRKLFVG